MKGIVSISKIMKKAVSVIIPCYNVKKYLSRCVNSLLNQTIGLENLELIFVDDASTDDTLEYLHQLEQQHPCDITVISYSDNKKQGAARNIGMNYATGKYIGFVDADDWIAPQMYEKMCGIAEDTVCDIVCCRYYPTNSFEVPSGKFKEKSYDYILNIQNEIQRKEFLAKGFSSFSFVVWNKLFRRDFIENHQLRFCEKYLFEDLFFLNTAAFYLNKLCFTQAQYYYYYMRPDSSMNTMNCTKWFTQRRVLIDWVQECINRGLFDTYYHEIEFIFGKDYYISNLDYTFNHFDKNAVSVIQSSQIIMKTLFPNAANNPYVLMDKEYFLYNFQKRLFSLISEDFTLEKIAKARSTYHIEILRTLGVKSLQE